MMEVARAQKEQEMQNMTESEQLTASTSYLESVGKVFDKVPQKVFGHRILRQFLGTRKVIKRCQKRSLRR